MASFYSSERGGAKMNFEGHAYNLDRSYSSHTTWRCIRSRWSKEQRCLGRARSVKDEVRILQEHNHPADELTVEALRLKNTFTENSRKSRNLRKEDFSVKKEEVDENKENVSNVLHPMSIIQQAINERIQLHNQPTSRKFYLRRPT